MAVCLFFSASRLLVSKATHQALEREQPVAWNWLSYSGTSAFGSAILRFPNPGMKVCTLCWTWTWAFYQEDLNSPPIMGSREINSVSLTCRSFLKIPAPGCYLCGCRTRDLKRKPGFRTLHCINSLVGSHPILVVFHGPYLRKFQAIRNLLATFSSQLFAL